MTERFENLPYAQTCRRVDFDRIEISPGRTPATLVLTVSGIAPWADLRVSLERLSCGSAPDFAPFELVGRLNGIALPAMIDFGVVLPISVFEGRKGIEIFGATRSERCVLHRRASEVLLRAAAVRGRKLCSSVPL